MHRRPEPRNKRAKSLSQGEIETRTGLKRCYISRVENGHTVPALETLEKFARALEVRMYQFFYENDSSLDSARQNRNGKSDWASHGKGERQFKRITNTVSVMSPIDTDLFLHMVQKFVSAKPRRKT